MYGKGHALVRGSGGRACVSAEMATAADDTHYTGMYSCFVMQEFFIFLVKWAQIPYALSMVNSLG